MSTTTAPERSLTQRRDALRRANEIRTKRMTLKRDIAAGRVQVRDLLLQPPTYIETMKVWDLLLAMPKIGRVRVNKALARCRISPSKTVAGLSDRQRDEITGIVGQGVPLSLGRMRAVKVHAMRVNAAPGGVDVWSVCGRAVEEATILPELVTCETCRWMHQGSPAR